MLQSSKDARAVADPRSSWRASLESLFAVGSFAFAHVVAVLATFTVFVTLPLVAFTMLFVSLIVFALFTNGDLGGPLFYPSCAIVIGLVGVSCSVLVCVVGLTLDVLRCSFGWPIWSMPLVVALLGFFVPLCATLAGDATPLTALADASLIGGVIVGAFATYWMPLLLSAGVLRTLRRWAGSLRDRARARLTAKPMPRAEPPQSR